MNGCTHFLCVNCVEIKPISQENSLKTAHTLYDCKSIDGLRYTIHYIMVCDDCLEKMESPKTPAVSRFFKADKTT